jgi:hypothetical protein
MERGWMENRKKHDSRVDWIDRLAEVSVDFRSAVV